MTIKVPALAWSLSTASIGMAIAGVWLTVVGNAGDPIISAGIAPTMIMFAVVGGFVASRRTENPVGWLLLSFAVVGCYSLFAEGFVLYRDGARPPGSIFLAWLASWSAEVLSPALLALAFLLFPQGRMPERPWRWLVYLSVVFGLLASVAESLQPGPMEDYRVANPFGIESAERLIDAVATWSLSIVIFPLLLGAALSLFFRFRKARGEERLQLKWFAFAAAVLAAYLVLGASLSTFGPSGRAYDLIGFFSFNLALLSIPVGMGIAILRYRLYEIDRIINKALVYVALTTLLAIGYATGVLLIQSMLGSITTNSSRSRRLHPCDGCSLPAAPNSSSELYRPSLLPRAIRRRANA